MSVRLILRQLPSLRRELVSQRVPLNAKLAMYEEESTFTELLLPHDGAGMKQCGLCNAGDDCVPCERHKTV